MGWRNNLLNQMRKIMGTQLVVYPLFNIDIITTSDFATLRTFAIANQLLVFGNSL